MATSGRHMDDVPPQHHARLKVAGTWNRFPRGTSVARTVRLAERRALAVTRRARDGHGSCRPGKDVDHSRRTKPRLARKPQTGSKSRERPGSAPGTCGAGTRACRPISLRRLRPAGSMLIPSGDALQRYVIAAASRGPRRDDGSRRALKGASCDPGCLPVAGDRSNGELAAHRASQRRIMPSRLPTYRSSGGAQPIVHLNAALCGTQLGRPVRRSCLAVHHNAAR